MGTELGDGLDGLLGPLGAEVMRVLWDEGGPCTPRFVLDRLNAQRDTPLAYTTIMTVMSRLAEKGVLGRSPARRGYAYEPLARDAAEIAVRTVVRDFGDAAVAHFVAEARADPKLRRRLERLLRDS
jgi:predicted transcriptional regulator